MVVASELGWKPLRGESLAEEEVPLVAGLRSALGVEVFCGVNPGGVVVVGLLRPALPLVLGSVKVSAVRERLMRLLRLLVLSLRLLEWPG